MSAADQRPPFTLDDLAAGYLFDTPPPGHQPMDGPMRDGHYERGREMYRLAALGLTHDTIGRSYGITGSRVAQIIHRHDAYYGGTVRLTARFVSLLRAGLLASLRGPADSLRQASACNPGQRAAGLLDHGLRALAAYCDLLREIGVAPSNPENPVRVDLAIHRWALIEGLRAQLLRERATASGRDADPKHKRFAQQRARKIERFLTSLPPLHPPNGLLETLVADDASESASD